MIGSNPSVAAPSSLEHLFSDGEEWARLDELHCQSPKLLAAEALHPSMQHSCCHWKERAGCFLFFFYNGLWHPGVPRGSKWEERETNHAKQKSHLLVPSQVKKKKKKCIRRTKRERAEGGMLPHPPLHAERWEQNGFRTFGTRPTYTNGK